jgi:hypothetical protein
MNIKVDGDVLEVDGIRFAREFFHAFSDGAIGEPFVIRSRENGVVVCERHVCEKME